MKFVRSSWNRGWFFGLLLVVATLVAYLPAWNGKPIWDDDRHLTRPELRSVEGLCRIWTQPSAVAQYYPLVHTVFWVEHKLWGDLTLGYHLINILLHAFSALLLLKILLQLEVPGAWLAAAIFALHPVQVESVAWISELKNTLSGVFCLGSALAYLKFDRTRNGRLYAIALGLFILGLLSKTAIATLPAALLVVFWWKRGRLFWKQDVQPLVPFLLTGIVSGLFTAWIERKFVGAEGQTFDFTVIERFLIAGRAFWFYLGKLLWPAHLVFIYPRWNVSEAVWWQYLFPAAALLLLAALWTRRMWWRGPLAGLLFFAGTLFPALGFFNVYPFRFAFVADHFQYLAGVGVITLASAGVARLLGRCRLWGRPGGNVLCLTLLAILMCLTWRQCGMYADIETLWRTTIAKNSNAFLAYNNLGTMLTLQGKTPEAIAQFRRAIEINPDYTDAYYNLGNVLASQGRLAEAIKHFQKAVDLNPDYAEAHYNLGVALGMLGRLDEAVRQYRKAIKIKPDNARAHYNLADIFFAQGQWNEAIEQYQRALKQMPDSVHAHYQLGLALQNQGRFAAAIAQFQKVLELDPRHVTAQNNLAWLLATCPDNSLRDGKRAVELAQQAVQLSGGKSPEILDTLAAAYAEAGRFPEAVETARRALDLSVAQNNKPLAEVIQNQLKLYEAGSPFRDTSQTSSPTHPSQP
jgi:tetratricopeptide (TPR) repeat protein